MPKILQDDGQTTDFPVGSHTFKAYQASVLKMEGGSDSRRVRVVVSTPNVDRGGDVVVLEGIDFGNYMKNPVVLLQHRAEWPVAKCVELVRVNGRLEAVAEFPEKGISADADRVLGLIRAGVLGAVSIGLNPIEWSFLNDKDPWAGVKYVQSEMLEFSFVAIPMNAEALILERSMGTPEQKAQAIKNLQSLQTLLKAETPEEPGRQEETPEQPAPETPETPETPSEGQDENVSEGACNASGEQEKMAQSVRRREVEVLRCRGLG